MIFPFLQKKPHKTFNVCNPTNPTWIFGAANITVPRSSYSPKNKCFTKHIKRNATNQGYHGFPGCEEFTTGSFRLRRSAACNYQQTTQQELQLETTNTKGCPGFRKLGWIYGVNGL